MFQPVPTPIRTECPPGACICERERLLDDPQADRRILQLTREEEKKLIARIESVRSYAELNKLTAKMEDLLGLALRITPSLREVRTVRGLTIQLDERAGLCRKTRQAIPAAVRRCLDAHPDITYALLDAHDLLGNASAQR